MSHGREPYRRFQSSIASLPCNLLTSSASPNCSNRCAGPAGKPCVSVHISGVFCSLVSLMRTLSRSSFVAPFLPCLQAAQVRRVPHRHTHTAAAMVARDVKKVVVAVEQSEGVGARVRRSIGRPELPNLDPFLLLDEFNVRKPAGFPE